MEAQPPSIRLAFLSKAPFLAEGTAESKRRRSLPRCTPCRARVVSWSSVAMSVWASGATCVCEHVCVIIIGALKQGGQCHRGRRALNWELHHFLCSRSAAVAGLHFLPPALAECSLFIVTHIPSASFGSRHTKHNICVLDFHSSKLHSHKEVVEEYATIAECCFFRFLKPSPSPVSFSFSLSSQPSHTSPAARWPCDQGGRGAI